jgi:tetratricopeptide (TPR) repeat protein
MLEHLGELGTAQSVLAVAEQRLADEECTKQLHWCLSPWALPWIMLEERQYEDAIEYLGEEVKRKASSQDANNLLARAYLEHGRQLSRGENIEQALSAWLCGLDHARDPGIQQQIREEAEQEAVEHAIRLQRENGRENLERAIKLLEDVRAVADTPRVRKNLAEFYSSLGILEGNDESQDLRTRTAKAQRLLKKALEVDPDNVKAKHNLGATMVGEIMDLYERGKTKQAIDKARQAYKMAPGRDDVKMLLSRLLSDVGVERFKADDYAEGVRLLREAYQVDPTNEHAMTNLSRALANYGIFQCNRGNMSEGKRLVEEALRVDPTNEHAKETLLQLMMQGY